ncbi:MAG: amidohydrolase family protein, partial [Janthinobacterium sp.]
FMPAFQASRASAGDARAAVWREMAAEKVNKGLAHLERLLAGRAWLASDAAPTIADAYLAATARWAEPLQLASMADYPNTARVLGAHLEGPYINSGKLGAQPNYARAATLAEIERLQTLARLRVITVAPEIAGHLDLVRALADAGVRVQIGHTLGSYEDGVAALEHGAMGFTHLFNAMSGLHHREPGMVGAALAHAEYAELIPDLLHVHPGAIKVALRAIPRLYGVTDATSATGMPDGEYGLGTQRVYKCLGCVRLATGSLAGSVLTMDQALRNFVDLGLDLADASNRLSLYPADYLGESERGRLAPGAWADIVVLDSTLQPVSVFVEGAAIDLSTR